MKKKYLFLTALSSFTLLASCATPTTPETTYLELWSNMAQYNNNGEKVSDATQTFNDKNQVIRCEVNYYDSVDPDIIRETEVIDYTYNDKGDIETVTTVITYINTNASTSKTIDTYSYNYYDSGIIKDKTIYTKDSEQDAKMSYYAEYDDLGRMTSEAAFFHEYRYKEVCKYTYKEKFTNYVSATFTNESLNNQKIIKITTDISNNLNDKGYITSQTIHRYSSTTDETIKTTNTLDKYNCAVKSETYITGQNTSGMSIFSYYYSENTYYKNNPDKLDKSIFLEYDSENTDPSSNISVTRFDAGLISFEYDEYGRTIQTFATNAGSIRIKEATDSDIQGITYYEYDREIPAK